MKTKNISKEKIKYIELREEYDECSPEYLGFKESQFAIARELVKKSISVWRNSDAIQDLEDIICEETENCDFLEFYDLSGKHLGKFQSSVDSKEVEKKLKINISDFSGYVYEDEIIDDKLVYKIILLGNGLYDGIEGLLNLINQFLDSNEITKYSVNVDEVICY